MWSGIYYEGLAKSMCDVGWNWFEQKNFTVHMNYRFSLIHAHVASILCCIPP